MAKAKDGEDLPEEQSELDDYLQLKHLITWPKRARQHLKSRPEVPDYLRALVCS